MKLQIGIIGPEEKNIPRENREEMFMIARTIGKRIAENNATLITGGCSGIVQATCQGAKNAGGLTVGTPGRKRGSSIPEIDIEICTPIDVGDYLFAGILSCDSIIVLPGDAGTMAELAIAYRNKKPLIFIRGFDENLLKDLFNSFQEDYPLYIAENAEDAAKIALEVGREQLDKETLLNSDELNGLEREK